MDKKYCDIFETNEYGKFKKLSGNRELASVKKIIESINRVGYILSPLCVNENFEVIDGQNRLEALKQLGLPVHYYIANGATIKEAISLNIGRSNWKPVNYIRCYASERNPNYIRLLKLINENQDIPMQVVVAISKNAVINHGIGIFAGIQDGSYVFTEKEYTDALQRCQTIRPAIKCASKMQGPQRVILNSLSWACSLDGVDKKRLINRFVIEYPNFRPVATSKSFLEDVEEMYNKRNSLKFYFSEYYKKTLDKKG